MNLTMQQHMIQINVEKRHEYRFGIMEGLRN
jgi:hypothetical protein